MDVGTVGSGGAVGRDCAGSGCVTARAHIASGAVAAALLASRRLAGVQLPIRTLAGRQMGDGRPATAASLDRLFGVAFAPDGGLLIADRLHSRMRRVDPATGVITTIVGSRSGSRNNVPADQGELEASRSRMHRRAQPLHAIRQLRRGAWAESGQAKAPRGGRTQVSGRDTNRLKLVCLPPP